MIRAAFFIDNNVVNVCGNRKWQIISLLLLERILRGASFFLKCSVSAYVQKPIMLILLCPKWDIYEKKNNIFVRKQAQLYSATPHYQQHYLYQQQKSARHLCGRQLYGYDWLCGLRKADDAFCRWSHF